MAQRATFIVDPQGIVRFVYVTDLSVGRSEESRVLDALDRRALPCNWKTGDDTLKALRPPFPKSTRSNVKLLMNCAMQSPTTRATSG